MDARRTDNEVLDKELPHLTLRSVRVVPTNFSLDLIPSSDQIIFVLSFGILGALTRCFSGGGGVAVGREHMDKIKS